MSRTNGATRVLLSAALMATMAGAVAPAAAAAEQEAACAWTPSILPLPAGALNGDVNATDGSGGYAGTISYGADSEQGGRVALWKDGKVSDYGNLEDPDYQNWVDVDGVNDSGTVVGTAYQQAEGLPSAIRSRNGKMERLPELPGADASMSGGVNDHGDIVGAVETTDNDELYWNPVIWPADKPGTVEKLTGLPEARAFAVGIDQDGTVLVEVDHNDSGQVPYLWKDGKARPLTLPDGAYDVITRGISNGRVIGEVAYESGDYRGVLWDRDGQPQVVAGSGDVRGINRDGQIVGRTDAPDWHEYGVWQQTKLGSTLSYAPDRGLELAVSSDDGTIAGRSWSIPEGRDEPTVWSCR